MVLSPSSLVGFLGFHPYMRLENFLVPALFLFVVFVLLFRNSKREEVGGEAEGKMHGL